MVLLVAAAVILVGMIVVGMGRGGEMAEFGPDVRPVDADIETAADVALLRPPGALWGYDKRSTDEALNLVARTVTERDVEIATLRRQIADMQAERAARGQQFGAPPGAATWPGEATRPGEARPPGVAWEPAPDRPPGVAWEPAPDRPPGVAWEPGPARPSVPGPPAGQADPGSAAVPFPRRQAGPPPPPAPPALAPSPETVRWSAWERPGAAPRPDDSGSAEPAEPGEPGDPPEPGDS